MRLLKLMACAPLIITVENSAYATTINIAPEPNAYALVLGGLGIIGFVAFRRARNSRLFLGKFMNTEN